LQPLDNLLQDLFVLKNNGSSFDPEADVECMKRISKEACILTIGCTLSPLKRLESIRFKTWSSTCKDYTSEEFNHNIGILIANPNLQEVLKKYIL
jgi:hypothetical protein